MDNIELRWFKYARGQTPVLQFRTTEGPLGDNVSRWWGSWQEVPMVFEKDGHSDN